MKKKKCPSSSQKLIALIFMVSACGLFLVAIIINFATAPRSEAPAPTSFITSPPEEAPSSAVTTTSPVTTTAAVAEVATPLTTSSRPDLKGIKEYSMVISVVYDNGLKIINQDVFVVGKNDKIENAPTDWALVSLDQKNRLFHVICQPDFGLRDCSGGILRRLNSGDDCERTVENNTKNSVSLRCAR